MRRLMFAVGWWLSGASAHAYDSHAFSPFGDVKYTAGFTHFDYADPQAPVDGTLRAVGIGTFDTLNPFNGKGDSAPGIGMLFSTLTVASADEPGTAYGLLAERVRVNADGSVIEFDLREQARFDDGTPLTAADAVFTFNLLREKGAPGYRLYYADVLKAEAVTPRTVRFTARSAHNRELPLILGQLPVLPEHALRGRDFTAALREALPGSGAYRVERVDFGRSIEFVRRPEDPLRGVASQVGHHLLQRIRYDMYRDPQVAFEAFKAGEFDVWIESSAKNWALNYDFPAVREGRIVRTVLPTAAPQGMQAFVFNLRRPQFADVRVREALSAALDFERLNHTLFYDQYRRTRSYFQGSELAAEGLPGPDELALLQPFRDRLPAEVFTAAYHPPGPEDGSLRTRLLRAAALLEQAGYRVDEAGVLRDRAGAAFAFDILLEDTRFERVALPITQNLRRLGIDAHVRVTDPVLYTQRVERFDYDMIIDTFAQSASPGNEQRDMWSAAAAERVGGRNTIGLRDPAVDALVDAIIYAPDRRRLMAACRALDRVLQWGHYVIPQWHFPGVRLAYAARFRFPDPQRTPYGSALPALWYVP